MKCPYCQDWDDVIKSGRNPSGSQIYKCKTCRRKFTPDPLYHGYSDQVRQRAINLYMKGKSLRQISRALDVSHQTVANWINAEMGVT
jgi:transposase-like protein